jgi:hypothetical protein
MAFWEVCGFINVVMPIMSMKNAKLIGISSPAYNEFNFFSRLQEIKLPNSDMHVCMTIKAELSCPACKKNGVGAYCTHHNSMLPPWISSKAKFIGGLIYKALKMEKAGERELSGVSDSSLGMAFEAETIKKFSIQNMFDGHDYDSPKYIGVFVDPNAGGDSCMAIVSVAMVMGAIVVRSFFSNPRICGVDDLVHEESSDSEQFSHRRCWHGIRVVLDLQSDDVGDENRHVCVVEREDAVLHVL